MFSNEDILVDVGSSTIKVYKREGNSLALLLSRSIDFKDGFDREGGLSDSNKKELFEIFQELKEKHPDENIKIFATALFRKMAPKTRTSFIDEFFQRTGLFFNIISQDLENFYLEVALTGKYKADKPVLLINIGGGSTELVVVYGEEAIERKNISLGVGTVLDTFPDINRETSGIDLKTVTGWAKEKLPPLENKVDTAFYSGGELNYMRLAGYPLEENNLFEDKDHPKMIIFDNFVSKNKSIFQKVTLEGLENMMLDNPRWMHGARACSALAQSICSKYNIETIIPSNSNIIDGANRQEFRYVTIGGSFRKHLDYILEIRRALLKKGVIVLSPRFTEPKNPDEEFVVFDGEEDLSPLELERHHLDSISKSDALIVCDPEGYVDASAMLEIGYAQALGKRIIFVEKPEEYMLNTLPAEIGL